MCKTVSKQVSRPNTAIHYLLYTPHKLPMPAGQLHARGWKQLTTKFPDQEVTATILGICKFGARIGYEGYHSGVTINPNLGFAMLDAQLVTSDIMSELGKNRLEVYPDSKSLPSHYTASLLGLTDKADGSKRRIHHLSYPPSSENTINSGIPEAYGVIQYRGIEKATRAVQDFRCGSLLIKRDFESAFRHMPISPQDTPLLGFH